MNLDKKTMYLMNIASCVDNYCKYLKKDTKEYASILGYVFRVHQDKIKNVSPQGIALILIYLKDIKEDDYGKYIDLYKDNVDIIIKESKNLEEQFNKMNDLNARMC